MTTEMIRLWSMQGAAHDGDGEVRSDDELRAALARRWTPSVNERPRLRSADEEEGKPLSSGIEGDDQRE